MIEGATEGAVVLAWEVYVDAGGHWEWGCESGAESSRIRGGVSSLDLCCAMTVCAALVGYVLCDEGEDCDCVWSNKNESRISGIDGDGWYCD